MPSLERTSRTLGSDAIQNLLSSACFETNVADWWMLIGEAVLTWLMSAWAEFGLWTRGEEAVEGAGAVVVGVELPEEGRARRRPGLAWSRGLVVQG